MSNIAQQTEAKFVESLGLLIKEGQMTQTRGDRTEYRNGWLDGYCKAWTQMTGQSSYELIAKANKSVEGCGKELHL